MAAMLKRSALTATEIKRPTVSAVLELLKPITWFAPMWAFGCGLVSGGLALPQQLGLALGSLVLAGPLLCGASQAVNDWFDRHVDAINEPNRPIPSGRIPGRWGLAIAIVWSALSLVVAAAFGLWVLVPAAIGSCLAWAYSAPPLRLKRNGWFGNAAVALSYEGLAWLAGAAVVSGSRPDSRILLLAMLYSFGAHGIMTLNDFKAVEGDTRMGVRSLPVQLGVAGAVRVACIAMVLPQLVVDRVARGLGSWLLRGGRERPHTGPNRFDAGAAARPEGPSCALQRHGDKPLRARHAGQAPSRFARC